MSLLSSHVQMALCNFYDLLGFCSQATWVLYFFKFPDCKLVKRKNREVLYTLVKQLVQPQISMRKQSTNFKFCKSIVKNAVNKKSETICDDILLVSEDKSQVLETIDQLSMLLKTLLRTFYPIFLLIFLQLFFRR